METAVEAEVIPFLWNFGKKHLTPNHHFQVRFVELRGVYSFGCRMAGHQCQDLMKTSSHRDCTPMFQGRWSRKRILLGQAGDGHKRIPHRGKSRFRFGVLHPKSVRVLVVAVRGGL